MVRQRSGTPTAEAGDSWRRPLGMDTGRRPARADTASHQRTRCRCDGRNAGRRGYSCATCDRRSWPAPVPRHPSQPLREPLRPPDRVPQVGHRAQHHAARTQHPGAFPEHDRGFRHVFKHAARHHRVERRRRERKAAPVRIELHPSRAQAAVASARIANGVRQHLLRDVTSGDPDTGLREGAGELACPAAQVENLASGLDVAADRLGQAGQPADKRAARSVFGRPGRCLRVEQALDFLGLAVSSAPATPESG